MLQVLQSLKNGEVEVLEVPCPRPTPGAVLIRTRATLISAGTERMLVDFGRASLVGKARLQPERVRLVMEKLRTDGLAATWQSVSARLDQPLPLGYSNAGVVVESGAGVADLAPGDRVVSNGPHAEFVQVPRNLVARIPEGVPDAVAAFTPLGAIALQGVRLAQPTLGERFVVIGLGLVGLLAVQLLRAHGCRVLGTDLDRNRLDLARHFGADVVDLSAGADPVEAASAFTGGLGADGVLIAAATDSSLPVHQAASMCRKRGRVVLLGVTGLHLARDDFYRKELTFQVSCSYGPGRYDPEYESAGHDYPAPFVRWTAQRNFEAVLGLFAERRLDAASLITRSFPIRVAAEAYAFMLSPQPQLGIVLTYPGDSEPDAAPAPSVDLHPARSARGDAAVGFLGAGNYATRTLIPAFRKGGAGLRTVVSQSGVTAACAGRKFGFAEAATDPERLMADPVIDTVAIATRHDSHARFLCQALRAAKHVWVEKPLALREDELDEIEALYRSLAVPPLVMVGFNRRFAPHVRKMKSLLEGVQAPKVFVMTVNAGALPPEHWLRDRAAGGGRILGEACHFIDLLRFLAGARIVATRVYGTVQDSASVALSFEGGSTGTIHYLTNGNRAVPKERLEVFCAGRWLLLDNFLRLRGCGWPGFRSLRLWRQDKGQDAAVAAFVEAIRRGGPSPIPFEELLEVSRAAIAAAAAAP